MSCAGDRMCIFRFVLSCFRIGIAHFSSLLKDLLGRPKVDLL